MKRILLFIFCLLTISYITAQNNSKYSLEVFAQGGISYGNTFQNIEKPLKNIGKPYLFENNIMKSNPIISDFIFRINKWGIIAGNSYTHIETKVNADKHYYSGECESFYIGIIFDILQYKWFTLSPYFAIGNQKTDLYLDYKLENGVNPTSLHILGNDRMIDIGCRSYFRVQSWKDNKWELFINVNSSFEFFKPLKWRFDNQLTQTEDKNITTINASIGASLRYYF